MFSLTPILLKQYSKACAMLSCILLIKISKENTIVPQQKTDFKEGMDMTVNK